MKFFSDHASSEEKSNDIPSEILSAVTVMKASGQRNEKSSVEVVPVPEKKIATAPRKDSPFLGEGASFEAAPPIVAQSLASQAPVRTSESSSRPLSPQVSVSTAPAALTGQGGKRIVWLIAALFLLMMLGGGAWWYFTRTKAPESTLAPTAEVVTAPIEPVLPIELPFSLDKPNYLSVDVETFVPETFRQQLRQTAERMAAAKMTAPVEFLLTDRNNNPVAFTRFAFLMQLELSDELLAEFDESFSLYVYNDKERPTLGLKLKFSEKSVMQGLISQQEAVLPYGFRALLYEGLTVSRQVTFRSGAYEAEIVRFVNIDAAKNVSFDHVLRDNSWLIGTSKDTLRAVMDKNR